MKKTFLLIIPLLLILLSSCAKEETRTYMFWWDQQTAENLYDDNIYVLRVFINDEYIGSESTLFYWDFEPNCGSFRNIEKSFEYTKKNSWESEDIFYKVEDLSGNILAYDVIHFTGDCFAVQLGY